MVPPPPPLSFLGLFLIPLGLSTGVTSKNESLFIKSPRDFSAIFYSQMWRCVMAFATTKDSMLDHEKFLALESDEELRPIERMAAGYLWAKVNTWCAKHKTDGAVPISIVYKLSGNAGISRVQALKLAEALVRARGRRPLGLWEPRDGGYQVHDYTDHNYSAATIEAFREAGSRGGKAAAMAKAEAKSKGQAEATATSKPSLKQVSNPILSNPILSERLGSGAHALGSVERRCEHGNPLGSCPTCEQAKDEAMKEIAKLAIQPSGAGEMRTARPTRIGS